MKKTALRLLLICVGIWSGVFAGNLIVNPYIVQMNIAHGYTNGKTQIPLVNFGKRSQDIVRLIQENSSGHSVPDATDTPATFTIAVLGDSYAWGQGILEEERFSQLLEQKLNAVRPTRVVSLSQDGDSVIDNYVKYILYTKNHHLDLTVITIVDNDLLFGANNTYSRNIENSIIQSCNKPIIRDRGRLSSVYSWLKRNIPWRLLPMQVFQAPEKIYEQTRAETYLESNGNLCVLRKILDSLPKDGSIIFFNYGDNWGSPSQLEMFTKEVTAHGFPVIAIPKMNDEPRLFVSEKDKHPSAYANKLFADELFKTIVGMWSSEKH